MSEQQQDASLITVADLAPVTARRRQDPDLESKLPKPYLARALVTVDTKYPHGRGALGKAAVTSAAGMSVLQQHVSFFDRSKNGKIYPWETFVGLRAIGAKFFTSVVTAMFIHLSLSYPTSPWWIPSPLLPIYVKNIHRAKHAGASETFDTEGRFDPGRFDAMFSKYASSENPDVLTEKQINSLLRGNKRLHSWPGSLTSRIEWHLFFKLVRDANGTLDKETLRGLYDGSIFYSLEHKRKSYRKKKFSLFFRIANFICTLVCTLVCIIVEIPTGLVTSLFAIVGWYPLTCFH